MELRDKDTAKKPYDGPQLVVYGDLRQITKAAATGQKSDGGKTTGADRTG